MIKGNKKEEHDIEDLLYYTSGGKDIYEHYLEKRISKNFITRRPWGTDRHPSWGTFLKDTTWLWKDQATEEVGNPITFVMKLFDISFVEAIVKIKGDLNLTTEKLLKERHFTIQKEEPKKYSHITAVTQRFKKNHHSFWNAAEATEDWCKKFNCFAVKDLYVNRKKYPIGKDETVFVYVAEDIDKVKVYFPERESFRFITNVQYDYLWEFYRLNKCNKLPIHKSMKDLIIFSMLYECNIATQNESVKIFSPEVVDKINSVSMEPWVFFGSDNDGVKKCTEITNTTDWKYINTPKKLLPDVNDVYSYVKSKGLKELENFCKQKKLL